MTKLLILGGTTEAADLAERTATLPNLQVTTSLAGRTRSPGALRGAVRVGGFGGVSGLASYLQDNRVDLLVDATHPYASVISGHAAQACCLRGVRRLCLLRPAWHPENGDRWTSASDVAEAAAKLPGLGRRAFLSIGRQELEAFRTVTQLWFLVRLIDPPPAALPLARYELVLDRGPFAESSEVRLMEAHNVDVVVSKNSGGAATYAKIAAARRLNLPVVMVDRPPLPPGPSMSSVDDALGWIRTHHRSR